MGVGGKGIRGRQDNGPGRAGRRADKDLLSQYLNKELSLHPTSNSSCARNHYTTPVFYL